MAKINLVVNGEKHVRGFDSETPVFWVLRDHLDLTGTKFRGGMAHSGACTIHLYGTTKSLHASVKN